MRNSFSIVSIIFAFILLYSCSKKNYFHELKFDDDGLCIVPNWLFIGPFDYDTLKQLPDETFFNKDIMNLGLMKNILRKILYFIQTPEAHGNYRKDERRISFVFFDSVHELTY